MDSHLAAPGAGAKLLIGALILALAGAAWGDDAPPPAVDEAAPTPKAQLFSKDDGQLDLSEFIDQAYGFVPVPIPITEPAVGYGLVGALAFIDKQNVAEGAGFGRPNLSVVGGMATENGTRGFFGADMRHWMDDRFQTLVGGVKASVNLDFYGMGRDPVLNENPRSYNIEMAGVAAQGRYRLGDTRFWLGLGYVIANTKVSFDLPELGVPVPGFQSETRIGGALPLLNYDSRDNLFTPTTGSYLELSAGVFSEALGGDSDFSRTNLIGMHYMQLAPAWTLGLRGSASVSSGDVPFYMRPFIMMRGVAAMSYQGQQIAQAEAEARWQFWQRYSLVGFAGAGTARSHFDRYDSERSVSAGGLGFRYEIARKYGLHMGVDLAFSKDTEALYVQFGNAWMRP